MYNLDEAFRMVDQIDSLEQLIEVEESLKDVSFTKIFWEQRKIALNGETDVIRKRARIKCRMIARSYDAAIPVSKSVQRFRTPHGFAGIHISAYAKVGKGCTIFQHVVIGSNTLSDSKNQGFPTVGENVYIGAGAMVIGNVRIGNNVRIGANAIITKDVPDNCVVVASGTRIIQREEPLDNTFVAAEVYKEK